MTQLTHGGPFLTIDRAACELEPLARLLWPAGAENDSRSLADFLESRPDDREPPVSTPDTPDFEAFNGGFHRTSPGGQTYSLPLLSVIRFTAPVSIVHAGTGADASGPGYRTGRVTGRQPGIGPTSAEIPRLRTQDLGVLTYLL